MKLKTAIFNQRAKPSKGMKGNIFRLALKVLDTKNGDMTKDEQELVAAAMIPLLLLPQFNDVYLREGLAELAQMVEAKG